MRVRPYCIIFYYYTHMLYTYMYMFRYILYSTVHMFDSICMYIHVCINYVHSCTYTCACECSYYIIYGLISVEKVNPTSWAIKKIIKMLDMPYATPYGWQAAEYGCCTPLFLQSRIYSGAVINLFFWFSLVYFSLQLLSNINNTGSCTFITNNISTQLCLLTPLQPFSSCMRKG